VLVEVDPWREREEPGSPFFQAGSQDPIWHDYWDEVEEEERRKIKQVFDYTQIDIDTQPGMQAA
jgi:hypothetical protein